MTIVEALSRVASRYSKSGYSGLSAQGQQEALDALNSGIRDAYRLMPDHYKDKELPLSVQAPAAATISAVNGSAALAGDAFTAEQVGRTVLAAGDDIQHRVAGLAALRDVWHGATGSAQATVYHDYVYGGDYPFNRLLAAPVLLAGSTELRLIEVNPRDLDLLFLRGVGRPRYYWLESGGVSQGSDLVAAIRLLPLPDMAYRLRVKAAYWPRRILFADVVGNASLPVPDVVFESVIQLAGVHTIGLAGWDKMPAQSVILHSQNAEANIRALPQAIGLPHNRVGTPRGY